MQKYLVEKKTFISYKLVSAVISFIILSFLYFSWFDKQLPSQYLNKYNVESKILKLTVSGLGTVVPRNEIIISAPNKGRISELHVRQGQAVNKDQILAKISNYSLEQDLQSAIFEHEDLKSSLEQKKSDLLIQEIELNSELSRLNMSVQKLKLELDANKKLVENGIISKIKFNQTEMSFKQSRLEVTSKKKQLTLYKRNQDSQLSAYEKKVTLQKRQLQYIEEQINSLTLSAKNTSIIKESTLSLGQNVTQGELLFTMIENNDLIVKIQIPQYSSNIVSVGQVAQIKTPNGTLKASVEHIDKITRNGAINVFLTFEAKLPDWIKIDQSIEAVITTDTEERKLFVASLPLKQLNKTPHIYTLHKNNKIIKTADRLIQNNGIIYIESEDIRQGDSIYLLPDELSENDEYTVPEVI